MTALYIILGIGSVLFTSWAIWTLNTELSLYCWINGKKVFRGYFSNLGDLNEYIYKLEALHGNSLTDWEIRTVRKRKYVKQVDDKLFVNLINTGIYIHNPIVSRLEQLPIESQKCIVRTKKTTEQVNKLFNKN